MPSRNQAKVGRFSRHASPDQRNNDSARLPSSGLKIPVWGGGRGPGLCVFTFCINVMASADSAPRQRFQGLGTSRGSQMIRRAGQAVQMGEQSMWGWVGCRACPLLNRAAPAQLQRTNCLTWTQAQQYLIFRKRKSEFYIYL